MPIRFRSTGLSLGRKLQRLSEEGSAVARTAIEAEVMNLIQEGFDKRVEPRGRAWEPRRRSYPWPILEKTGRMRESFTVNARGPNISVENDAVGDQGQPYPLFHQKGWTTAAGTRAPARQVMPISSMPAVWKNRLDRVVKLALEALK